jgi:leader peptidase (prepilin peptidase)/N-methyltransferase
VIAAVVCALAGLVVGAFLNVLIERIPIKVPEDRLPLHLPPSCTWCGETRGGIGWIPILGAVKPCPACHDRPRRRELVVEVVTAAMFVTMSIHFHDPVVTIAYLFFCAFLVAVSAIDLEHYRIPDRLVFPSLAIAVPLVVLVSFQQDIPEAIPRALVGAATIFGVLLIFHLISPRGMGFGDVKLALMLGLFTGWLAGNLPQAAYLGVIAMFFGA